MISKFSTSLFKAAGSMSKSKLFYTPLATFAGEIKSVPGNKPPTLEESPHARYASVLFTTASAKESLHTILEDVKSLRELYNQSEAFQGFIANASFKRTQQMVVLKALFEKSSFNQLTVDFLAALVDNQRLDLLPKILDKYIDYNKILAKEETITIISAFELTDAWKKKVTDALKEGFKGVNFTVKYQLDPTILGGLQMYSGNTFMDASLISRVQKVKHELAKITV